MKEKLAPLNVWDAVCFCLRHAERIEAVQASLAASGEGPFPTPMAEREMFLKMARFFEVIDQHEAAIKECLREELKKTRAPQGEPA